jgi:hypothetical protein
MKALQSHGVREISDASVQAKRGRHEDGKVGPGGTSGDLGLYLEFAGISWCGGHLFRNIQPEVGMG